METSPVKGHFLSNAHEKSVYSPFPNLAALAESLELLETEHTDVVAFNGGLGCPESQPNIFIPSSSTLADFRTLCALGLLIDEDVRLLLKCALGLHRQFCSHDCGVAYWIT